MSYRAGRSNPPEERCWPELQGHQHSAPRVLSLALIPGGADIRAIQAGGKVISRSWRARPSAFRGAFAL
eukprot:11285405-Alexandrium_andersonii.AAC.1